LSPGDLSQILGMAVAPNGRDLATGHGGGALKVWDAATGRERFRLEGHRFSPRSLAFFPDGEALASGSVDGTVRIWDLAIGRARATLKVPGGMVKSVAVSPDGQVLASIAGDGSVRLWSAGAHAWPRPVETDRDEPWDAHTLSLSNNLAWALATCPDPGLHNRLVPSPWRGPSSGRHRETGCSGTRWVWPVAVRATGTPRSPPSSDQSSSAPAATVTIGSSWSWPAASEDSEGKP